MLTRLQRYLATALLFALGGWLTVHSCNEILDARRLARDGLTAAGRVIEAHTRYESKRGLRYYITVEFSPTNHAAVARSFNVDSGVYHRAVDSGTIQVQYLADDPSVCSVEGSEDRPYPTLAAGLFMLASGLHLLWFFRNARRRVASLCVEEHQMATVNAIDYRHLDYAFYENGRRTLENHGYRFLADREDLTFRRDNGLRIAIRSLLSHDGATLAGLYHLRQRWLYRLLGAPDCRILDLETRFANGDWLITSNATAAGALSQPPGVNSVFLPVKTPLETIIEAHQQRLAAYQQAHPDTALNRAATLEDADRLAADLQRRKALHRQATGLTREELQKISGQPPSLELSIVHDGIAAGVDADRKKAV